MKLRERQKGVTTIIRKEDDIFLATIEEDNQVPLYGTYDLFSLSHNFEKHDQIEGGMCLFGELERGKYVLRAQAHPTQPPEPHDRRFPFREIMKEMQQKKSH